MKDKVGMEFEGIISSVTSFGLFVELENTIEGLIRISSIEDDYYMYDEKHHTMIGERTKRTFRIGDVVKIRVEKADVATRTIDFALI
jgi:ribonuclease R